MDNQRLLIWAAFGVLLWLTWQAWMRDYGQQPAPVREAPPAAGEQAPQKAAPPDALPELPAPADQAAPQGSEAAPATGQEAPQADVAPDRIVHVRTDVLDIRINTRGGTLEHAELLDFPVEKDRPDDLVTLLSRQPDNLGLVHTGLRSKGGGPEPNHQALFKAERNEYVLDGGDQLTVSLTWDNGKGLSVVKQYTFERGSYIVKLEQTVNNGMSEPWQGAPYAQILRHSYPQKRSTFNPETYSFHGPLIYDGKKASKLKRDDLETEGPFQATITDGWVAAIQHHFLIAVVPAAETEQYFTVSLDGDIATSTVIAATQTVAPGAGETFSTVLFVGPKLQRQLGQVTDSLTLSVDYGWLTPLSHPLFLLLSWIEGFVHNWGVAIIIVTALIKLVFYKLTQTSGRSMAKMREIQPRMKALQERYKDDRQALSQAMMELYKREKVNPAAGCLPMLIQMPFFLAFYWVLIESVEMRQAPFALWITDLSSRDPYFILPLIMGAAMLFQQRLNPAPADPVQARVMQIMPLAFTVFFAFFPSGLVLYWVTNTLLGILQQWRINKVVEEESRRRRGVKAPAKAAKQKKKNDEDKPDAA